MWKLIAFALTDSSAHSIDTAFHMVKICDAHDMTDTGTLFWPFSRQAVAVLVKGNTFKTLLTRTMHSEITRFQKSLKFNV